MFSDLFDDQKGGGSEGSHCSFRTNSQGKCSAPLESGPEARVRFRVNNLEIRYLMRLIRVSTYFIF